MWNSIATGKQLATRIVLAQSGITLLVAGVFLTQGGRSALAALCAGLSVLLGNGLLALRLFLFPHVSAGSALMGLLIGTALKWMVVLGGLYLVLGYFQLPPVPALCGVIAALAVQLMGLRFQET